MIDWIKTYKLYVIIGIVIIFAAIYFLFKPGELQGNLLEEEDWFVGEEIIETSESITEEVVETVVIVDVKGAVNRPGVYEAETDERVIDMINKAGGLNDSADEAKINFAIRVEDEMVIYVPEIGESLDEGDGFILASGESSQKDGKVNINSADEAELQTLPGIGPSKAKAIIDFRDKNGPFKAIEDLKLISGIGDKSYEKLQEFIKVK
ncbi:competence protein ComEA [Cytobacillus eiseniae]|uniref:Competence protein ComEA n=1 Tax=Cytobacillus eiseniae TaxID=762947 RepID=A0ABS4RFL3_9BACI|nr:helix-hairpin-helix domain-containing protein [Cytobacillus eiseniae]MBP2241696.1 competence protein ComEA [Cytobacillus eiseniae]